MDDLIARKKTRIVKVGNHLIGGNEPIVVQTMTNTKTSEVDLTVEQIQLLAREGCELVRVAVPDQVSAEALEKIVLQSPIPIIADIHFDLELAFQAMDSGASKIRINPGNIGGKKYLLKLARRAESYGIALRIGVNSGSLEKDIYREFGTTSAEALVKSALRYQDYLEEIPFREVVFSLKASSVYKTVSACRIFSSKSNYPLHIGITEAGPPQRGIIKSSIGIGALLMDGIGDTIRVSLTSSPLEEVKAARGILQALHLRCFGPEIISCPTCGRCETDLQALVSEVENMLMTCRLPLTVAVMGCAVNGPGEAREADIGVSAGKEKGIIFCKGKVIKTVNNELLVESFKNELKLLIDMVDPDSPGGC